MAPIGEALASGELSSEDEHKLVRQVLGASSVIPAKRGKKT